MAYLSRPANQFGDLNDTLTSLLFCQQNLLRSSPPTLSVDECDSKASCSALKFTRLTKNHGAIIQIVDELGQPLAQTVTRMRFLCAQVNSKAAPWCT